uniref:BZIP domain-containing protein n=1 Tax=Nyssomyia neivai TaxID=330878 RepID=A0A1L8DD43_9DIPT
MAEKMRRGATKYPTISHNNSSGNESNYDSQQETESNYSDDTDYTPPSGRMRRASVKRLAALGDKSVRGKEVKAHRQPTRRPDPNVFNRNALMARENRKRKKELMEQLEREVIELREKSKKLHWNLARKTAVIKNLKHERKYFQSVIANQTEIVKLLRTLNTNGIPISSSIERSLSTVGQPRKSIPSPDSSTPFHDDRQETDDDYSDDCLNMSPSSEMEDLDAKYPLCFDTLPELPLEFSDAAHSGNRVSINSEHNYFNQHFDDKNADVDLGGVCLHVASGKVSLEFCAFCHTNATTWMHDED